MSCIFMSVIFSAPPPAANWHELMIPQRTMRPSIVRVN